MVFKHFGTLLAVFLLGSNGVPLESPEDNLEGYFQPLIIGGVQAPDNYAPHMAGLVVGYDFLMLACGASIVSKRSLLTAAHCIEAFIDENGKLLKTYHAVVGSNNWNTGGLYVHFKDFLIHPQWDSSTLKHDVGILKLEKELPLNKKIDVIPLGYNHVGGGVVSYVTGWGFSRPGFIPFLLQMLKVKTIGPKTCVTDMKNKAAELGWSSPDVDPALEICTMHSVNHGNCHGDSGSALVSMETNEQIGIATWVIPCGVGAPDVYVRISAVKAFIMKAIQK